jgi:sucrose-6-phosphate hydrolase SacC (GH32 family)
LIFTKPAGLVKSFGINVKTDYDKVKTVIGFEGNSTIYVDRSQGGVSSFSGDFANLNKVQSDFDLTASCNITLDILIDHSSIEVLFFDG